MDGLHRCDHLDTLLALPYLFLRSQKLESLLRSFLRLPLTSGPG